MEPVETIFVDGHLVGHIAQDIGFEAFNHQGSYVGTFPTKQQARRALEREPVKCVRRPLDDLSSLILAAGQKARSNATYGRLPSDGRRGAAT